MVPFWSRCTTHFSLFQWKSGCSLYGVWTHSHIQNLPLAVSPAGERPKPMQIPYFAWRRNRSFAQVAGGQVCTPAGVPPEYTVGKHSRLPIFNLWNLWPVDRHAADRQAFLGIFSGFPARGRRGGLAKYASIRLRISSSFHQLVLKRIYHYWPYLFFGDLRKWRYGRPIIVGSHRRRWWASASWWKDGRTSRRRASRRSIAPWNRTHPVTTVLLPQLGAL